jgi:chloramphenicol 3-O-phosphotransferase
MGAVMRAEGRVVLFGGAAGAGKSTLARAWCATRTRAVHIGLDDIRSLIVSGLADPQQTGALQADQYEISVEATCTLARLFSTVGYDVAIDDVIEPRAFSIYWEARLAGLDWHIVIVAPSLEETLERMRRREKHVKEDIIREQHRRSLSWPASSQLDTTGLSVEESLHRLLLLLGDR